MTTLKHPYVNPQIDDGDPNVTGPDEWNADHVSDHAFVVLGAVPASLTGARQLAVSSGLSLTDAGAGSTITINVSFPGGMTGFANPSASVGLSTVNGSATTAMRSDAAPALSQSIVPTWTGLHTFQKPTDVRMVTFNGTGTGAASWSMFVVSNGDLTVFDDGANNYNARFKTGGILDIPVGFRISNAAASGNYLRGNGTNFVSNTIQSGDLPGSFSGFANPSASVGLAAVNGAATTAMRSDAAPALSQAIIPTWTGLHVFQKATGNYMVQFDGTGTGAKKWGIVVLTTGVLAIDDVTAATRALNLITGGILDMPTGFRIAGAAASTHYLRGNGTNYVDSAILAGDLPGSFSGFANPSASVGLAAVNGSATTAMRSDAAPPLSQAIAPTWTGIHTWTATSGAVPHTINGWAAIGSGLAPFVIKDDSNGSARIEIVGSASSSPTFQGLRSGGTIASPTRTLSAAVLAGLDGGGYDNAGTPAVHRRTGSFRAVARNDWTTANFATYWILSTTGANTTFNDRYYFFDDGSHLGGYVLVAASTTTPPTNTTAGDLTSTRYFNLGGRIDLLGGTFNQISFGTNGVAAPGAGSAGAKIGLFASYGSMGSTSEYWIGLESAAMWFNTGDNFKFYRAGVLHYQIGSSAHYMLGFLNISSSITNPANTTQGDLTAIRGHFGSDVAFGSNETLANIGGFFKTTYNSANRPASDNTFGGVAFSWNFSAGGAEVDIWQVYDAGATGFSFKRKSGASTHVDLLTITGAGDILLPGYLQVGSLTAPAHTTAGDLNCVNVYCSNIGFFTHATGNYMIEYIGTGTGAATYGHYIDTSSQFHLDYVGVAQICLWASNGDYQIFGSNAYKASGTAWANPSDVRIKNVTGDFSDGLATVLGLRPRRWIYNDLAPKSIRGTEGLGLVAQEAETVAPYMVSQVSDRMGDEMVDDYRVIDVHALQFMLINAVKELSGRVQELEAAARNN